LTDSAKSWNRRHSLLMFAPSVRSSTSGLWRH